MEKYIGEKKVMFVPNLLEGEKTPGGQEIVEVNYEDGSKEIMPKLRFELIVTDVVSNTSEVQEKIKTKVGATLFGMMHEYGLKFSEVDGVLDTCTNLVNSGFHKAQDILFGFNQSDIPLNVINKILLKDYADKNSNGTSSVGSESNKVN